MTVLGKLDGVLDTTMKNIPKGEIILLKHEISDKTSPGQIDDELDEAVKNVSRETKGKEILLKDVISDENVPEETEGGEIFPEDVISDTTLPGELVDELDTTIKNVPKETEGEKILPKDPLRDTTLPGKPDSELDKSMKNVPKKAEEEKILPKDAIKDKTLPGKLDVELDKAMKNVPKKAEGEKISPKDAKRDCTPLRHMGYILGELLDELTMAMRDFRKNFEEKQIFLTELQMDGCKHEFFCQAEQEMIKKVSGLPGARFDHFRTDKKLMFYLNMYNKCHVKACKPVDDTHDQIPLNDFLKNLWTCVRTAASF
ncbi:hypothetical protein Q8A67_022983 [Cirrhinus molitorella]|uniref:Uncharacterized protein n=1 Tax=Cirrhinus molitorella TaxID=172907 RepID=A0AA88P8V9_9TELE|nr:hypothetical protein Q8A67_022983 [Cirrhinus molitorella]